MLLYTIFSATYIVHTCSTVVLHLGILTITYELYKWQDSKNQSINLVMGSRVIYISSIS